MLLRKACRTTSHARDEFDKVIAKKMEISSEITKYRDRMKSSALERFLTWEGQKDEKNRQMIKSTHRPANLVRTLWRLSNSWFGTDR